MRPAALFSLATGDVPDGQDRNLAVAAVAKELQQYHNGDLDVKPYWRRAIGRAAVKRPERA
jgi:hypothetical protein